MFIPGPLARNWARASHCPWFGTKDSLAFFNAENPPGFTGGNPAEDAGWNDPVIGIAAQSAINEASLNELCVVRRVVAKLMRRAILTKKRCDCEDLSSEHAAVCHRGRHKHPQDLYFNFIDLPVVQLYALDLGGRHRERMVGSCGLSQRSSALDSASAEVGSYYYFAIEDPWEASRSPHTLHDCHNAGASSGWIRESKAFALQSTRRIGFDSPHQTRLRNFAEVLLDERPNRERIQDEIRMIAPFRPQMSRHEGLCPRSRWQPSTRSGIEFRPP